VGERRGGRGSGEGSGGCEEGILNFCRDRKARS
jgi:hypothetical protein